MRLAGVSTAVLWFSLGAAFGQPDSSALAQRPWLEARSAHFITYSCGSTQEVARLTARLEQFREAYSVLAGGQAVASPPVVVMAFPDHATLRPFLPLYQGKPANLAAFFRRGSDENLIVLSIAGQATGSLQLIFHEYSHLLLRHNEWVWPIWLKEGMAEIYSSFEVKGEHTVRIGAPHESHLRILASRAWLPLKELFAVTHKSPAYNERERQGIFYSESWLLTHYLMLGDNAAHKQQFGQLTALLRRGQLAEPAFTNAFHSTLRAMENDLHRYFERGKFESLPLVVSADIQAGRSMTTRRLAPVEVDFRLGDMLLRVERFDAAESWFERAEKLAPKSPLPFEGLGLLEAEQGRTQEAIKYLEKALQLGSTSFLAHYTLAREKYALTADSAKRHSPLPKEEAAGIRAELHRSLALMPDFGPAHHLLGFFEMVQGENLMAAEQHLQKAIQLEPENQSYLFALAQTQLRKEEPDAARRTLEPLRLPNVDPELRRHAEEMIRGLQRGGH